VDQWNTGLAESELCGLKAKTGLLRFGGFY
jgi:hypothetical protein